MAWQNRSRSYNMSNTRRPTYSKPEPVPFVRPTFTPSTYQRAIIETLRDTRNSVIVDAVAGSGKTSTLQLIVDGIVNGFPVMSQSSDATVVTTRQAPASYVVVAFNKSIATTLQDRGMNGRTFHSLGYSAVMTALTQKNNGVKPQMDAQKVARLIEVQYGQDANEFSGALNRLVSLAKNHMLTPDSHVDDFTYLIDHFDIEAESEEVTDDRLVSMAREMLAANNRETRTIDYDDQLYFVELFGLRMPTFDFVLVDESQDTNPLRRSLVKRMMHATSRIVAVGDERQAIYGFTGASHDSMDLIAAAFDCVRLPLSVSYRCPVEVVKLAQTIVPHILPRDGAPQGSVERPASFKRSAFLPTDLVICRNTAPLVQTAYKMLAARIPCKIMGREIGKSLTSLIKRLTRKSETLDSLQTRLFEYQTLEVARAMKQHKEAKAQSVQDKVEAICSILDSMTPEDADGGIPRLVEIIDSMFADTKNGCTTLATVHKAKGLEAPRVVILDPQLMPSKMARQDWQLVQERNLMYVAYTRALDTLLFVETKKLTD